MATDRSGFQSDWSKLVNYSSLKHRGLGTRLIYDHTNQLDHSYPAIRNRPHRIKKKMQRVTTANLNGR